MMIRQISAVNWRYVGDAIPSFVVMAFIPFSYSVAYGLIAWVTCIAPWEKSWLTLCRGLLVYTALNTLIGVAVWASRGRLEPRDYDLKEYWTWKGPGQQPWFVRAINKRKTRRESCQNADQSKRGLNLGDEQSSFDHSRQNSSTEERLSMGLAPPPRATTSRSHKYS